MIVRLAQHGEVPFLLMGRALARRDYRTEQTSLAPPDVRWWTVAHGPPYGAEKREHPDTTIAWFGDGAINLIDHWFTSPGGPDVGQTVDHEFVHALEAALVRREVPRVTLPTGARLRVDEPVPGKSCTVLAQAVMQQRPQAGWWIGLRPFLTLPDTLEERVTAMLEDAFAEPPWIPPDDPDHFHRTAALATKVRTPAPAAALSELCAGPDCNCSDIADPAERAWLHEQFARTGRYRGRVCASGRHTTGVCAVAAAKGYAFTR